MSYRTGFHFWLDPKTKQKSQENFILPPTKPTPARAKFSAIARIPIASGFWKIVQLWYLLLFMWITAYILFRKNTFFCSTVSGRAEPESPRCRALIGISSTIVFHFIMFMKSGCHWTCCSGCRWLSWPKRATSGSSFWALRNPVTGKQLGGGDRNVPHGREATS